MENSEVPSPQKRRKVSTGFLIALVALILALAGFTYYYIRASSTMTRDASTISGLDSQVSSLKGQVDSANARVSSLRSQVSTLEKELAAANSQATSAQEKAGSLETEVSTLRSQSSSAGAQVADLQKRISTLKTENTRLQSIASLSESSVPLTYKSVTIAAGQSIELVTFMAEYPGYILVTATSTDPNASYLRITQSFSGYLFNNYQYYIWGGVRTILVPVLPGSISVSFSGVAATGVFSVTYHY